MIPIRKSKKKKASASKISKSSRSTRRSRARSRSSSGSTSPPSPQPTKRKSEKIDCDDCDFAVPAPRAKYDAEPRGGEEGGTDLSKSRKAPGLGPRSGSGRSFRGTPRLNLSEVGCSGPALPKGTGEGEGFGPFCNAFVT